VDRPSGWTTVKVPAPEKGEPEARFWVFSEDHDRNREETSDDAKQPA